LVFSIFFCTFAQEYVNRRMKKAFDVKVGDTIIYKSGYKVITSEVVAKPIDDEERPNFKIGRVDLANGEYITRGSIIYDSEEEAKQAIRESIQNEIDREEETIEYHQTILKGLKVLFETL